MGSTPITAYQEAAQVVHLSVGGGGSPLLRRKDAMPRPLSLRLVITKSVVYLCTLGNSPPAEFLQCLVPVHKVDLQFSKGEAFVTCVSSLCLANVSDCLCANFKVMCH